MLQATAERLQCPRRQKGAKGRCGSPLEVHAARSEGADIRSGHLECERCRAKFPILSGVLILVDDVRLFLLNHVKGISRVARDEEIPREWRNEFAAARREIAIEHIEEDLESERVLSLYVMNHYLQVSEAGQPPWWAPRHGSVDPVLDRLVREYWDRGPLSLIAEWTRALPSGDVVELGCGVAGLYPRIKARARSYLGVDSSFSSIAIGRHLALGASYEGKIQVPEDLLHGSTSREVQIQVPSRLEQGADLIVGDLTLPILRPGQWDLSVALNAIDMLEEPAALPALQFELLKAGGTAIQSCPYVWHEAVARKLRARIPKDVKESSRAVEWLYRQKGFEIAEVREHVPWLFFKHVRQLEIYSAHIFRAAKS